MNNHEFSFRFDLNSNSSSTYAPFLSADTRPSNSRAPLPASSQPQNPSINGASSSNPLTQPSNSLSFARQHFPTSFDSKPSSPFQQGPIPRHEPTPDRPPPEIPPEIDLETISLLSKTFLQTHIPHRTYARLQTKTKEIFTRYSVHGSKVRLGVNLEAFLKDKRCTVRLARECPKRTGHGVRCRDGNEKSEKSGFEDLKEGDLRRFSVFDIKGTKGRGGEWGPGPNSLEIDGEDEYDEDEDCDDGLEEMMRLYFGDGQAEHENNGDRTSCRDEEEDLSKTHNVANETIQSREGARKYTFETLTNITGEDVEMQEVESSVKQQGQQTILDDKTDEMDLDSVMTSTSEFDLESAESHGSGGLKHPDTTQSHELIHIQSEQHNPTPSISYQDQQFQTSNPESTEPNDGVSKTRKTALTKRLRTNDLETTLSLFQTLQTEPAPSSSPYRFPHKYHALTLPLTYKITVPSNLHLPPNLFTHLNNHLLITQAHNSLVLSHYFSQYGPHPIIPSALMGVSASQYSSIFASSDLHPSGLDPHQRSELRQVYEMFPRRWTEGEVDLLWRSVKAMERWRVEEFWEAIDQERRNWWGFVAWRMARELERVREREQREKERR